MNKEVLMEIEQAGGSGSGFGRLFRSKEVPEIIRLYKEDVAAEKALSEVKGHLIVMKKEVTAKVADSNNTLEFDTTNSGEAEVPSLKVNKEMIYGMRITLPLVKTEVLKPKKMPGLAREREVGLPKDVILNDHSGGQDKERKGLPALDLIIGDKVTITFSKTQVGEKDLGASEDMPGDVELAGLAISDKDAEKSETVPVGGTGVKDEVKVEGIFVILRDNAFAKTSGQAAPRNAALLITKAPDTSNAEGDAGIWQGLKDGKNIIFLYLNDLQRQDPKIPGFDGEIKFDYEKNSTPSPVEITNNGLDTGAISTFLSKYPKKEGPLHEHVEGHYQYIPMSGEQTEGLNGLLEPIEKKARKVTTLTLNKSVLGLEDVKNFRKTLGGEGKEIDQDKDIGDDVKKIITDHQGGQLVMKSEQIATLEFNPPTKGDVENEEEEGKNLVKDVEKYVSESMNDMGKMFAGMLGVVNPESGNNDMSEEDRKKMIERINIKISEIKEGIKNFNTRKGSLEEANKKRAEGGRGESDTLTKGIDTINTKLTTLENQLGEQKASLSRLELGSAGLEEKGEQTEYSLFDFLTSAMKMTGQKGGEENVKMEGGRRKPRRKSRKSNKKSKGKRKGKSKKMSKRNNRRK